VLSDVGAQTRMIHESVSRTKRTAFVPDVRSLS
jgi:hypothetical protein